MKGSVKMSIKQHKRVISLMNNNKFVIDSSVEENHLY